MSVLALLLFCIFLWTFGFELFSFSSHIIFCFYFDPFFLKRQLSYEFPCTTHVYRIFLESKLVRFVLQDVLTQCFTEKIARFLVHASTVSTAIWRQVPVTNANTASLDKALLQVNVYSLGICFVFKK